MNLEALAEYEAAIAIVIGIFLCFFGYRIKKVAFVLIWFMIGFLLSSLVVDKITPDTTMQLLIQVGAGIILGVLGFSIEKLCIFAVATFSVSTTLIESFQLTEIPHIALAIGAGVIVGIIAVKFIKPIGIVTTSLSGSKLIAKYAVACMNLPHAPYFIAILGAFTVIGVLFQFKNCKHLE